MRVRFYPKQIEMDCVHGESIYEAAIRQGIRLPIACKNGVCCICKASLLLGQVKQKRSLLDSSGKPELMLCQTWPQTDCDFEIEDVYARGELPVKKVTCQVEDVSILKGHVYQVRLLLPAGKLPEFFPGQYLALNLPGKDEPSFYSIASRPGLRTIELHIQADPHLSSALQVVDFLRENDLVAVDLPFGQASLVETPGKPLILIAAGTGFAQMKSIIEHLIALDRCTPIALYWGVRQESDLYHFELAQQWLEKMPHFSFTPLISELSDAQSVEHHHHLAQAVMQDHQDFSESLVFVSGSPRLVYTLMDDLVDAGLPEEQFFSDVLEYAPRNS